MRKPGKRVKELSPLGYKWGSIRGKMSGTRDVVTGAKNRILEMLSFRGQSKEDESVKLMEKGYSEERGVTLFSSCKKRL